ncbi:MAG: hypothetical protein AAFO29_11105, partial [Actinomycetota bacterium]
ELIERLHQRGIEVETVDVGQLGAPGSSQPGGLDVDRWINRVNAMPSDGRPPSVVAATGHLLLDLELRGHRVINGHRTWAIGASKQAQIALFERLGFGAPASIAIDDPAKAPAAAAELGFPVVVKPNIGGSGAGVARYDRPGELDEAVAGGRIDLGIDGTGLVQRSLTAVDGLIHRIELLGTELFYATDQVVADGVFNYCAADGCAIDGGITLVSPPPEMIAAASTILAGAGADVGGVEYLIDQASGQPCFFDLNPYSNFVAGRDDELGFDPIERYLDHVLA